MKQYLKGFLLLGVILMVLGAGLYQTHKIHVRIEQELQQVKGASRSRFVDLKSIERSVVQNESSAQAITEYVQVWEPFLSATTEAPKLLNDIVSLSFRNTIAVSEKSTQVSRMGHPEGIGETILLSLKVIGKFERIYKWLGEVESQYPHARVTELVLSPENRNASLKLGLEVPKVL